MAFHMLNILGDLLYVAPVNSSRTVLPSPNELKRKILVKAKKIQPITEADAKVKKIQPITEANAAPVIQLVKQPSVQQSSSTAKLSMKRQVFDLQKILRILYPYNLFGHTKSNLGKSVQRLPSCLTLYAIASIQIKQFGYQCLNA